MKAGLNDTAGATRRKVTRIRAGLKQRDDDLLATEVPVALRLGDEALATMLATPCDLEDFALGFCLSEGLIAQPSAIRSIDVQERLEGIEIVLEPAADARIAGGTRERSLPGRSGCGLCGARTLEDVVRIPPRVTRAQPLDLDALRRALAALPAAQPLNTLTGAMHAAAWCRADGRLHALREDIGRHNALDKLIGAMTREAVDFSDGFALLTSRASYEMVMKAATVGIGAIAAISAPTALAATLAESTGVTLLGFARGGDAVVYAHPERVRITTDPHMARDGGIGG